MARSWGIHPIHSPAKPRVTAPALGGWGAAQVAFGQPSPGSDTGGDDAGYAACTSGVRTCSGRKPRPTMIGGMNCNGPRPTIFGTRIGDRSPSKFGSIALF